MTLDQDMTLSRQRREVWEGRCNEPGPYSWRDACERFPGHGGQHQVRFTRITVLGWNGDRGPVEMVPKSEIDRVVRPARAVYPMTLDQDIELDQDIQTVRERLWRVRGSYDGKPVPFRLWPEFPALDRIQARLREAEQEADAAGKMAAQLEGEHVALLERLREAEETLANISMERDMANAEIERLRAALVQTEWALSDWLTGRPQHISELLGHELARVRAALSEPKESA